VRKQIDWDGALNDKRPTSISVAWGSAQVHLIDRIIINKKTERCHCQQQEESSSQLQFNRKFTNKQKSEARVCVKFTKKKEGKRFAFRNSRSNVMSDPLCMYSSTTHKQHALFTTVTH
jgi:hypothetical protein